MVLGQTEELALAVENLGQQEQGCGHPIRCRCRCLAPVELGSEALAPVALERGELASEALAPVVLERVVLEREELEKEELEPAVLELVAGACCRTIFHPFHRSSCLQREP